MILKMLPKVLEQTQSIFQVGIFWQHASRFYDLIKMYEGEDIDEIWYNIEKIQTNECWVSEPGWDKTNKYSRSLIKSIPLGSALFGVQPIINGFLWLLYPYIDSDENFKLPLDVWKPDFLKYILTFFLFWYNSSFVWDLFNFLTFKHSLYNILWSNSSHSNSYTSNSYKHNNLRSNRTCQRSIESFKIVYWRNK